MVKIEGEGEEKIRIAQVSCGTIYGNVQREIERAAKEVGAEIFVPEVDLDYVCLLYTSPSPRDKRQSRMPSSA